MAAAPVRLASEAMTVASRFRAAETAMLEGFSLASDSDWLRRRAIRSPLSAPFQESPATVLPPAAFHASIPPSRR